MSQWFSYYWKLFMSTMDCKSSHFKLWEAWHCFHMEPTCTISLMGPSVLQSQLPFPGSSWPHVDPWFQADRHIHSSMCPTLSSLWRGTACFLHLEVTFLPRPLFIPMASLLWSTLNSTLPSASSPLWRAEGVINYFIFLLQRLMDQIPWCPFLVSRLSYEPSH